MSNTMVQSDLAWTAFRYISNEMPADEAAAFELRLAADQESREEVARAVELTQTMARIPQSVPQPATVRPWRQRLSWMTAGAAVCLAVMLCGEFVRSAMVGRSASSVDGSRIAGMTFDTDMEVTDTDANDADLNASGVMNNEVSVPSWLLAAVTGKPATHPDDNPDDDVLDN
jgi:hypothetical protein